ncbi:hypothetical protein GOP47_0025054 [Adiantum capillus-veneris]|uniref:Uncharacterized protein n=1 Tax=Adiantum capillus-veneris TaxID=13818 RepID=A0A9D4U2Y2_ADICA|nr:hypothetical protein GOP47_0025054 [Adiantum capillus-veneris]
MFNFYNSAAKADWDSEFAHVFSSMFPLAFKHTDTFETKEVYLKTSVPLSTSYIDTRRKILHNLKDGLARRFSSLSSSFHPVSEACSTSHYCMSKEGSRFSSRFWLLVK